MIVNGHTVEAEGTLNVDPFKKCLVCADPVQYGYGWRSIGSCGNHSFKEITEIITERKELMLNEKTRL